MNRLTTTDGKRVGYWTWDLSDGEESAVVTLRVVPADGFFLKSTSDGDVSIWARKGADPFTNISTTPLDLSALPAETPINYEFKAIAAATLTDVRCTVLFVGVTTQAAAAWDA